MRTEFHQEGSVHSWLTLEKRNSSITKKFHKKKILHRGKFRQRVHQLGENSSPNSKKRGGCRGTNSSGLNDYRSLA